MGSNYLSGQSIFFFSFFFFLSYSEIVGEWHSKEHEKIKKKNTNIHSILPLGKTLKEGQTSPDCKAGAQFPWLANIESVLIRASPYPFSHLLETSFHSRVNTLSLGGKAWCEQDDQRVWSTLIRHSLKKRGAHRAGHQTQKDDWFILQIVHQKDLARFLSSWE